MAKVLVIGGGVIGLSTAWYLARDGHTVEIVDDGNVQDGCSYGNAGMVVPSHVLPLAQPGMIAQGIRWMFNSKSPFYVHPRLSRELFGWGWQFYRHATQAHVDRSKKALLELSLLSKSLYQEHAQRADFAWRESGLFMLYQSEKVGEEERHAAEIARELGLEVDFHSATAFQQLETGAESNVLGAIQYKSDALLNPQAFMNCLKEDLRKMQVAFHPAQRVVGFRLDHRRIQAVETTKGDLHADEIVLCAGSWSPKLARMLGEKIRVLPGKGYSFTRPRDQALPSLPAILCEGKVAVSPYADFIRFGGTMEITHAADHRINMNRVQGIVETVRKFYPQVELKQPQAAEIWHGFRPCTPSGLPIISRSTNSENLIIATGHAMMGLSLGPATGKLVSELLAEKHTSIDLDAFSI